jgi:hypothetical protein
MKQYANLRALGSEPAILTLSALVGAVAMARAVDDPELSDEILTRTANALHRRAHEAAG